MKQHSIEIEAIDMEERQVDGNNGPGSTVASALQITIDATQMLQDMCAVKHYGKLIIYKKFFYSDPAQCEKEYAKSSELIPLDSALQIELTFHDNLHDACNNISTYKNGTNHTSSRIIDSILYFYNPGEMVKKRELLQRPLLFISAVHCIEEQRNELKNNFDDLVSKPERHPLADVWYYKTLDTAAFVLIISADTYRAGIKIVQGLLLSFPGVVFNTHTCCWTDKTDQWSEEGLQFGICFDQKNSEGQNVFNEQIRMILPKAENLTSLVCIGNFERTFLFHDISGRDIIRIIRKLHEVKNLYYESQMQVYVTPQELDASDESYEDCPILQWQERLKNERECFERKTHDLISTHYTGPIAEEIFVDVLTRLSTIIKRIETSPVMSPLTEMLAYSFRGFIKVFEDSFKHNICEAFYFASKYLYEILRIHESTSLHMSLYSQTPGRTEIFRAVSTRLIYAYYRLADQVSFLLRKSDDDCIRCMKEGEAIPDKYYYLFSPDAEPAVRITPYFPSLKPSAERLLVVGFPQQMLFRPAIFLPSLMHEIAHYAGDKLRMRVERAACFIQVISEYITDILIEYYAYIGPDYKKLDAYKRTFGIIYHFLKESFLEKIKQQNAEGQYYVSYFKDFVSPALQKMVKSETLIKIVYAFFEDPPKLSEVAEVRSALIEIVLRSVLEPAQGMLDELINVTSEVYSDIVAIVLLEMNAEDYINVLQYNSTTFRDPDAPLLYERIYIVDRLFEFNIRKSEKPYEVIGLYKKWESRSDANNETTTPKKRWLVLYEEEAIHYFSGVIEQLYKEFPHQLSTELELDAIRKLFSKLREQESEKQCKTISAVIVNSF